MKQVVLVTGEAGDAQGWGNMHVTEAVRDAIIYTAECYGICIDE